jgi:predicted TIM-barrel fold metal-dependent hydrolase
MQRLGFSLRWNRWTWSVAGLVFCLSTALFVNAQQPAAPAAKAAQNQPAFSAEALEKFSSLEPVDTHSHVFVTGPTFVAMLERVHMHLMVIIDVDDSAPTTPYRASFEREHEDAMKFKASSNGHAQICTTFSAYLFNEPDFAKKAIEGLNRNFKEGAVAVKMWKNVGMEVKNKEGKYILPDDPRLQPILKDIASHNKTLITHIADPDVAWGSTDPAAADSYYKQHPIWDFSTKPDAPRKKTLLDARDHMLAMNPKLRVVGAHFGSMEDDIDAIAARLDRYPNFAVDTASRLPNLQRQPQDKVRAFLLKYQDRILYGTDLGFYPKDGPDGGRTEEAAAREFERRYASDWRYLGTDETFDVRGKKVQGLNLPREVLKKIYHDNAAHWIPGVAGNSH